MESQIQSWTDPFTGTVYEWESAYTQAVRQFLAEKLAEKLVQELRERPTLKDLADQAARFWKGYYELVFPLRFGKEEQSGESGFLNGSSLFTPESDKIHLLQPQADFRTRFLDDMNKPPILSSSDSSALISDHHLACAALLNIALRTQGVEGDILQAVRLGVLLHELSSVEAASQLLEPYPLAKQVALFLDGQAGCPVELTEYKDLIQGVHEEQSDLIDESVGICVVGVAAQRIKQYVFESPGLNEIRGASELLDGCVEELAKQIGDELGPEVILQSVASTLTFLAPSENDVVSVSPWVSRLRKFFYCHTGTAFVASAALPVDLKRMLEEYSSVMGDFFDAVERDRNKAHLPHIENLPFEKRCSLCSTRPAEGVYSDPENQFQPICRACMRKREIGQDRRRKQQEKILKWLGIQDMTILGIREPEGPEENEKTRKRLYSQDLSSLIPDDKEQEQRIGHRYVAMIYGDGSNFGPIVKNLKSLSQALHWTHRAEKVALAAAAVAIGKATQEAASRRKNDFKNKPPLDSLPFQILAIGGDDISLFTWGSIALRFSQVFLELTDMEFAIGSGDRIVNKNKPICFGLGVLVCDEKTPVRRVVDFTSSELLKWAKKAVPHYQKGTMTFLLASTAEQIPGDLKAYQDRMYYSRSGGQSACLTLRPLTATELNKLLECASEIKKEGHTGRLQRLVAAFSDQPLLPALLHYIYQRERFKKQNQDDSFFAVMQSLDRTDFEGGSSGSASHTHQLLPANSLKRGVMGKKPENNQFFSPLWDLMEIMKILQ
jgi:hypothetical protein